MNDTTIIPPLQAPPPTARQLKKIDRAANIERLRKDKVANSKVANNERLCLEKIEMIKNYEQEKNERQLAKKRRQLLSIFFFNCLLFFCKLTLILFLLIIFNHFNFL